MTQFALDTFTTGTAQALESYSSSWVKVSGDGSASVSDTYGRVYYSSTAAARYHYSGATPASADYSCSVDVYVASTLANSAAGPTVRHNGTTFYLARTVQDAGYQMFKCVSGSYTQLGSTSSATFTAGNTYNLKIEANGTSIKLYINGSGTATISATDSAITAANYAGIYKYDSSGGSDTSGHHIDNFSADTLGAGGTVYSDSFTESVSAADTHSQSAIFANAISEGLTTADSYLQNLVFTDTVAYGISASDALGHIQTILESIAESVTAGFSQSDSLSGGSGTIYSESFSESVTTSYTAITTQVFVEALSSALSVSEAIADNAVYSVAVTESISALDAFVVSDGTLTLTQADIDAIAAAVLAAINAAPPKVNLWNVRSQDLVGDGSATPWGPA